MAHEIVISGSGISGLLSALLFCRKGDGPRTYMIEKNAEPGGLLRRFNYGEWGNFDYGMHYIQETALRELDDLLFGLLPENEWQILEGPKRDLAGIYFNGQLQTHTPYIDLRSLSPADGHTCTAALLEHLHGYTGARDCLTGTAEDYAVGRFGRTAADHTILPSVEKIHQRKASELDYMATLLTPMSRLAFCDEAHARELTRALFLRDRIAWPDQRTLPAERSSGRKAFYPRAFGTYRIVDAILKRLAEAGAHVLTGAEITGVTKKHDRVQSVQLLKNGEAFSFDDIQQLVWTANIPALGRHLGVDFTGLKHDKPLRTIVVNLVVDRPPERMGDLYYFFCYDPRFHTFRLTNFTNYSSGAPRNGGYPVCVELLMSENQAAGVELAQLAVGEFHRFGVGDPSTRIMFAKAEQLETGFPMPSVNNLQGLRCVRNKVREMALANLDMIGILAEDNLFFQTDVLADAFRKLN